MSQYRHDSPDVEDPDLTKFKLRILAILAEERRYGLAIKRELEDYYGSEVNHGRLYPNLDELVKLGYVSKTELDKRTNEYAITADGVRVLADDVEWVLERLGVSAEQIEDLDYGADVRDQGGRP